MKNLIVKFISDEEGASAAEYALILAVLVIGIAGAAISLGENVGGAIQDASDMVANPVAPAAP